jgi:hypothetical protein
MRHRFRSCIAALALAVVATTTTGATGIAHAAVLAAAQDEPICSTSIDSPKVVGYFTDRKVSVTARVTCPEYAEFIYLTVFLTGNGDRERFYSDGAIMQLTGSAALPCRLGWYEGWARGQWKVRAQIWQETVFSPRVFIGDCSSPAGSSRLGSSPLGAQGR